MRHRMLAVPLVGIAAVLVGVLVFGNVNRNLVYYLTPSEAIAKRVDYPDGKRFRLGGLVEDGTVLRTAGGVSFTVVSDVTGGGTVSVDFQGAPSQLFKAGVGVVVEGSWQGSRFVSGTMIIKHDAEYRPPKPGESPPPAEAGRP